MTGKPDRLNQLQSGVAADAQTLTLKHELKGISEGSRLAIDLEEYHVISRNGTVAGSTVTVIPAFEGSATTAHAADAIVYVQPSFSDWRIANYINEALEDISAAGLFRIKSLEFDYVPSQVGYNINASDLIDIWRVRYDIPGPSQRWPQLSARDWYLDQAANVADFADGKALILKRAAFPGHKVHVSYKAGFDPLFDFTTFDPLTDYSDDVLTVTGLHREAHSIPPLLSAIYLLGGRDIKRTLLSKQPEPRRQEEVPVGGASQAMRPLLAEVQEHLGREITRLKRRYPKQAH
jgi:hypothetical protein